MYYIVTKHDGHRRTRGKCRKHEPQAGVFFISRVFSMSGVFHQCNTRLRLLHLLYGKSVACKLLLQTNWEKTQGWLNSFVIPFNSYTFSDWRKICHVSWFKLTNCLGKKQLEPAFDSHVIRSSSLKLRQIGTQFAVFSIFKLEGITKHLMIDPAGNSEIFPLDLNVPLGFTTGNTEGLGETKLTVSLGPGIKCLLYIKWV